MGDQSVDGSVGPWTAMQMVGGGIMPLTQDIVALGIFKDVIYVNDFLNKMKSAPEVRLMFTRQSRTDGRICEIDNRITAQESIYITRLAAIEVQPIDEEVRTRQKIALLRQHDDMLRVLYNIRETILEEVENASAEIRRRAYATILSDRENVQMAISNVVGIKEMASGRVFETLRVMHDKIYKADAGLFNGRYVNVRYQELKKVARELVDKAMSDLGVMPDALIRYNTALIEKYLASKIDEGLTIVVLSEGAIDAKSRFILNVMRNVIMKLPAACEVTSMIREETERLGERDLKQNWFWYLKDGRVRRIKADYMSENIEYLESGWHAYRPWIDAKYFINEWHIGKVTPDVLHNTMIQELSLAEPILSFLNCDFDSISRVMEDQFGEERWQHLDQATLDSVFG